MTQDERASGGVLLPDDRHDIDAENAREPDAVLQPDIDLAGQVATDQRLMNAGNVRELMRCQLLSLHRSAKNADGIVRATSHVRNLLHARNCSSSTIRACIAVAVGAVWAGIVVTKSQAAAAEYKALLRRYDVRRDIDLVRLAKERGIELDPGTLSRIRNAKAKGDPQAETLRKIAAVFGLGRAEVFPSSTDVTTPGAVGLEADPYWGELRGLVEKMSQAERARLLERAEALLESRSSARSVKADQASRLVVAAKAAQLLDERGETGRPSSTHGRSPTPKPVK